MAFWSSKQTPEAGKHFSSMQANLKPGSQAEDCMGMLGVDVREWIIWAIFKCTKLHYTFCNVSTPRGLLQNLYIYKETVLCLFCKACLQFCIAWRRPLGVETLQKYDEVLNGIFSHKYTSKQCLISPKFFTHATAHNSYLSSDILSTFVRYCW